MLHAWRIAQELFVAEAFSGQGAKIAGGRWNNAGSAVVYTAGSASLAMLEVLVHLQSEDLLQSFVLFEMTFEESLVTSVDIKTLPEIWRETPPPQTLRHIGNTWLTENKSAILRVPSSLVPTECNFLINPAHRDFSKITIGPKKSIHFDPRLIKAPPGGGTRN